MNIGVAIVLILVGYAVLIYVNFKTSRERDNLLHRLREVSEEREKMRSALIFTKPVVGALVAASDNKSREMRKKVYDRIEQAVRL